MQTVQLILPGRNLYYIAIAFFGSQGMHNVSMFSFVVCG